MPIDPAEVYNAMECAYRHEVINKFLTLQDQAFEVVMKEAQVNIGDLLYRVDDTQEKTIQRADRMLETIGPLIKYANNDRLMAFVSRLLDIHFVQRLLVKRSSGPILKVITGEGPSSFKKRIKITLDRIAQGRNGNG